MKRKFIVPLIGLILVVLAGAWWWHGMAARRAASVEGAKAANGNGGPALVVLAPAVRQDVPVTVQVNGSVVSLQSVDLRPQIQNTVRTVHVKEGQFVRTGELLFSLDDRADRANLAKAQAQQTKDEATLADLERQYRRSQELVAQNFIAQSAADATRAQLDAQRAAVAADRAAVQAAQVQLGYSTLRAPISGRIGAVLIYPGTLVQPATSLVTITQLDPIAVSFPVPEGQLQDLLAAAHAGAQVEAVLSGRAQPLEGRLNFVDNTVDPQIGTVRAKAVFPNADHSLWPGQFVETRVRVRTLKDATVLPAAAIMMLSEGSTVYVVDAQQTAMRRKVRVLYNFGTQVAAEGVAPGEQVVVEGKQNVHDGGKVRVNAGAQPGGAPGLSGGRAASAAPVPGSGERPAPAAREHA